MLLPDIVVVVRGGCVVKIVGRENLGLTYTVVDFDNEPAHPRKEYLTDAEDDVNTFVFPNLAEEVL